MNYKIPKILIDSPHANIFDGWHTSLPHTSTTNTPLHLFQTWHCVLTGFPIVVHHIPSATRIDVPRMIAITDDDWYMQQVTVNFSYMTILRVFLIVDHSVHLYFATSSFYSPCVIRLPTACFLLNACRSGGSMQFSVFMLCFQWYESQGPKNCIETSRNWNDVLFLQHWEHLCECKPIKLRLQYRHTLAELTGLLHEADKFYSVEAAEDSHLKRTASSEKQAVLTKKVEIILMIHWKSNSSIHFLQRVSCLNSY